MKVVSLLSSPDVIKLSEQIPRLKIVEGKLSTADGARVDVVYPATGKVLLIVDPLDTLPSLPSEPDQAIRKASGSGFDSGAAVLIQSKKMIFRLPGRAAKSIPISRLFRNADLTGPQILRQLKDLANVYVLPIFLFFLVACPIFVLMKSYIIALLMKLFRLDHSVVAATRLIIVASTPSMLLSGLSVALSIHLGQFEGFIFSAIFFVYVWLAFFFCGRYGVVGK